MRRIRLWLHEGAVAWQRARVRIGGTIGAWHARVWHSGDIGAWAAIRSCQPHLHQVGMLGIGLGNRGSAQGG